MKIYERGVDIILRILNQEVIFILIYVSEFPENHPSISKFIR